MHACMSFGLGHGHGHGHAYAYRCGSEYGHKHEYKHAHGTASEPAFLVASGSASRVGIASGYGSGIASRVETKSVWNCI